MSVSSSTGRHEAPAEPGRPASETFTEELRDAFAPRTLVLVVGVALLCLGFVLSYVGAFHDPTPHRIPVALVAPAQVSDQLVDGLNDIDGGPVRARAVDDEATARRLLERDEISGALLVDPSGTVDTLLVATGQGAAISTAVERVFTAVEADQQRTLTVTDVVPHQSGDPQGSSVFYVAVGAVLAGYLLAAVLGMAKGARPATFRRTLWRLGATVPYSLAVGLGIAIVVGPVLGALTGHFGAVFAVATLLVLSAATVTMSFQVLFGIFGIAATILVFVVVGNPSAGGAYPYPLLPTFWRTVGPWLPNGAGVDALRSAVYFGGTGMASPVWIIVAWIVAGTALTVLAARVIQRRTA
ncbi:hypothetical protein SAMN05660485_01471 [Blastococcus fimeti]|nr:hypothetical protein SAMN05660485_01471 [Blastococcus fimeti]